MIVLEKSAVCVGESILWTRCHCLVGDRLLKLHITGCIFLMVVGEFIAAACVFMASAIPFGCMKIIIQHGSVPLLALVSCCGSL